ncbi:unnamed protein product [Phytophthora fragariaefolia]|uniref:Unnamed protein product n=1 Tax=Phytophthora fragariaefolia TaxID=1490495 RepID=A0A9W7CUJ8_9STRA|nr:unnamed protein product [Phytophthora fragariaefolia]
MEFAGQWHDRGASAQEGAWAALPGPGHAHQAAAAAAAAGGYKGGYSRVGLLSYSGGDWAGYQEESDRLNALINGTPTPTSNGEEAVANEVQVQTDSSLLGLETLDSKQSTGSIVLDVGKDDAETTQVQTDSSLLELETLDSKQSAGSIDLDVGKDDAETIDVRITELAPSYGFNNAYNDFFRVWHGEVSEILSLPDPEHMQPEQRRTLREAAEEQHFDIERYLMDFANQGDDMYFELAMAYEPFWTKYPVLSPATDIPKKTSEIKATKPLIVEISSEVDRVGDSLSSVSLEASSQLPPASSPIASKIQFTESEQELLLRLPRKEFLLPEGSPEEKLVIGGLVDILIGFAYEQLTTQGDSGVESTWTVSIVSPTLSWLDSNADLRAVVRSTVRRMITFPFLRQYALALRCVREASEILKRGKRVVLRALLALYRIIEKSETQYLLNSLYIQDYCVWIQSVHDERLQRVSAEVDTHVAAFKKDETGWALEELERSIFEADDSEDDDKASPSSNSDFNSLSEGESSSDEESSSSDEDDSGCENDSEQ